MHTNSVNRHWRSPQGFTLIELLVVIVIIGILAAIALPNYIKVKEKAKEAEVKANLHNIQLTVERFAVDSEGSYPNYLIGGEPKYAESVLTGGAASAFANVQEIDPQDKATDPLLRRGYIDAYPKNPFTKNGLAVHQLQEQLPSSTSTEDPLRNGYPDGIEYGTRFGPYCTSMGAVLCEPRYTLWQYVDMNSLQASEENTWCNIEYQFWDMWEGNKPLPYLPGQFFYKGTGPIIAVGGNNAEDDPILPTETDQYMMGGYGGIRTKGKDILGPERPIVYFTRTSNFSSNWVATNDAPGMGDTAPMQGMPGGPGGPGGGNTGGSGTIEIWPWTRSQFSSEAYEGSPYQPASIGDSNEQLQYGNPNGIRDGIILVLTAGEDYIGDR
jgi:prepilin-type N-terminal cleavage/methylation domain-containing protein